MVIYKSQIREFILYMLQEKDRIELRLKQIERKLDSAFPTEHPLSSFDSVFQSLHQEDEVDLFELFKAVWDGKWILIGMVGVFIIVSVTFALSLPDIYKSETLLAPVEENAGGGLAGLAGQFGGLASLAGVNLGGGRSDKSVMAIEVLKSREFATKFIQQHNILVPLMAANGWNRKSNELKLDPDIYDFNKKEWIRDASFPRAKKPSMQEAKEAFSELLSISQDKQSNFVKVAFEHYSPNIAKQWVDWLVHDINVEIKARDVAEAKRSIEYLEKQLEKTPIAEMQAVFYELIEEQTKTIMFAEVRDEYVFKTIDSSIVPELKSGPKRALMVVLGGILGCIFGVIVVLVRYFVKKQI